MTISPRGRGNLKLFEVRFWKSWDLWLSGSIILAPRQCPVWARRMLLTSWTKLLFNQPPGQRRANVHVRVDGNPNQRYPLLFRDYLRAHPNSARSIDLIKREIAKRHADDMDAYYDIKDPVYDLVWEAAQDWSRQTGWQLI